LGREEKKIHLLFEKERRPEAKKIKAKKSFALRKKEGV